MTLLASTEGEFMSSTDIAGSLNVNPVLVRKELSELKSHNFIESKEGKNGGIRLIRPAKSIKLSEIFALVKGDGHTLGLAKNEPNPNCPIGKKINNNLSKLYDNIDSKIEQTLIKTTLEEFKNQF